MPADGRADGGLPGAITLSPLEVLAGLGTTPQVALVSRVAYLLIEGEACLRALSFEAGCQQVPLCGQEILTLSAGVLHQVLATAGSARLLRLCSDAPGVAYPFPFLVLADAHAYWRCACPPSSDGESGVQANGRWLAYRHQLAVQGFAELWAAYAQGPHVGQAQLARVYRSLLRLFSERLPALRAAWRTSTLAQVTQTAFLLKEVEHGHSERWHTAWVERVPLTPCLPELPSPHRPPAVPARWPRRLRGGRG